MSTALLQELHQEYRRLYIAGSELAAGDFRLKRLLPQFQQLGERSPVFKKLGEGMTALIEPGSPDGPAPGIPIAGEYPAAGVCSVHSGNDNRGWNSRTLAGSKVHPADETDLPEACACAGSTHHYRKRQI